MIPFDENSRIVIMSDCHRGQGNTGDNFLPNQILFAAALEKYYRDGYTYIEIGDGDELWENRSIRPIIEAHSDIFKLMSRFYGENRLYMLYGNHDVVKRSTRVIGSELNGFYCDGEPCTLFPGIKINEGIVLENRRSGRQVFLVHGHQGNFLNDTIWRVARFLVRYLWKPLELVGFTAPTGAAMTQSGKESVERKLAAYAKERKIMLIAGHTHRPVYPEPGKGLYFNDGCCVHPKSITAMEIVKGQISLVKWTVTAGEDMRLYVEKTVLEGPNDIESFYARL